MDALDILRDTASRPLESLRAIADRITPANLNLHPAGHDNSIAWLLWHTGREIDVQLAHLTGGDELWHAQGFRDRSGLGRAGDAIGYGHSPDEARAIAVDDASVLVDYVAGCVDALLAYLDTLSEADLDDVVDDNWDPPVTRGVRLVSIIDDAAQHIAQAAYVTGMPTDTSPPSP
ncbi:mycothiol transferase [Tessaracoccus flavus]|uniref:Aspartate/tyrosine/aromatic aminotransferase n=1 Tax=Tessaracoccus flavus TaxID=1610493 RepID=A0A1Q2CBT6_9ACTN|nr:DinB family protein [Tessaracoccus flavus]AQP43568.1 aspartate/tyrosine/aromatic aminotransferase [Tessaracoccus flavus]SDY87319.1 DinB superfamily protein [Tessaracoccus flavus]